MKPAERPCDKCGEPQYFDEDPSTYFSYIVGQGSFELDADVAAFLSSKLNYAVSDASRKLRIDKIIEGRATFLKLAGDLDGSFPREKLAEGLEGQVIMEVAGIGKIEPAGAAEWRGFLQMVTPSADAIYLLGVPPVFLEKLTRPEDLGPKAQVISFAIPYTCNTCSTTSLQPVDVEQHYDVLKFATPPETRCADCKNPMVCAASESLLSHLTTLPKPSIGADTKKFIKDVKERKPEKKKVATTVAEAAATTRGGSFSVALLAAVVVAVLLVGGFFVYRQMEADQPGRDLGKKVYPVGGEAKAAWAEATVPFGAACTDLEDGGMTCVGASSPAAALDDADAEARMAALDQLAFAVAARIDNADWQRMAKLWTQPRTALLEKYGRDASSANRQAVNDARRRTTELMVATGAVIPATPSAKYYEEWQKDGDSQFISWLQYTVSSSEVKRMVEQYSTTETVLGAKVATVYPLVAWQYPTVEGGAVILGVDKGPLQEMGLVSPYVVVEVGSRDGTKEVSTARDFVEHASATYERLKKDGGRFLVLVERGTREREDYHADLEKPKAPDPVNTGGDRGGGDRGGGDRGGKGKGTGNVNVWDRYGGGDKGGRDDPTQ
jgi:hypothetical protein